MAAGERPSGAPFWGESLPIDIAVNIAGSPLGDTYEAVIATRGTAGAPTDHATMTAGDVFNAWARGRMKYMIAGDTVEPVWVVEVKAGSGVLRLRDGRSVEGDTPTGTPPNDLGTQTITGPGTYLWPCSSTATDLLNPDLSRSWVQVEGVSGSVDIQQVKLRVWPSSGPLGSLEGQMPASTQTWAAAFRQRYEWLHSETSFGPDYDTTWYAAWAAMQSDAAAHPAPGDSLPAEGDVATVSSFYGTRSGANFEGTTFDTVVESQTADLFLIRTSDEDLMSARVASLPGLEGVDFIADPNEVWVDPVAYVHLDEPIVIDWDLALDYTPADPMSAAEEAAGQVLTHVTVQLIDSTTDFNYAATYPDVGPVIGSIQLDDYRESDPASMVTHTFPLDVSPDVDRLRVQARHQYQSGSIPAPHGQDFLGATRSADAGMNGVLRAATHLTGSSFSAPGYYYTRPSFKFWVPADPRILPLRQFPRNDGLKGGPGRFTPDSRQAGRLNGYL